MSPQRQPGAQVAGPGKPGHHLLLELMPGGEDKGHGYWAPGWRVPCERDALGLIPGSCFLLATCAFIPASPCPLAKPQAVPQVPLVALSLNEKNQDLSAFVYHRAELGEHRPSGLTGITLVLALTALTAVGGILLTPDI